MAEFGIASGALQVADAGLKLAKTLYNYLDAVRKADKELSSLAREVTVTSTTLSSLGHVLQDNKAPALYTQDLVDEATLAFRSCEDAFKDVDATFKSVVRFDTDGKGQVYLFAASEDQLADSAAVLSVVTPKGRWAWPLKKGKIDMLQANLERLKTTLLLMLSVLSFAKANEKSDRADDSRVAVEKLQIDNLIKAQENATTRYDELVASFTQLETHVTSLTFPPVDATSLVTTNAFITIPPTQAWPLGGRTPVDINSSVAQPEHAIRSQLGICVSAVSQLAQAFDTAAQSWKVGTNLELAAMSNAFDDVKYHFVHLHRINKTIQSQGQHHSDAGSAPNGFPCPLPNSITRAPEPPKDERTALVSQAYMKVQRPQYMREQQQQGQHNVTHQQHHALQQQQQQLNQAYSGSTQALPMGRDSHTSSPVRQGTSPQEQASSILANRQVAGQAEKSQQETQQTQPPWCQTESASSFASHPPSDGRLATNTLNTASKYDPAKRTCPDLSIVYAPSGLGGASKLSRKRQQQILREQMQQQHTQQRQLQQQQELQRQQMIRQQQSEQQQTDRSSKKRSWSETNAEADYKPEPSKSEGGDQKKRSRGQEEVVVLPSVADMHTTDDTEVEMTSSAVDALVKRWTKVVTDLGS
ncbi:hypothetical protein LTR17_021536 [Elasticomyces elasticus]|nr:hypothetical protein LTR17_021536 [Elasticomyces elasticus]